MGDFVKGIELASQFRKVDDTPNQANAISDEYAAPAHILSMLTSLLEQGQKKPLDYPSSMSKSFSLIVNYATNKRQI